MRGAFGAGALIFVLLSWKVWGFDQGQWKEMARSMETQPTEVRSDSMEVRKQENLLRYKGNVIVSQPTYRLEAQEVELRWDPETRRIKQVLARGGVRMETEDATGRCGVAVVDVDRGVVEMRESPRMIQRGEHVEGEAVIYSLEERRSTVLGGKTGRVRTMVIPGGTR